MPWIKDIPIEDYHHGEDHIHSFSSSNIKDFIRSPAHCRWNKDNPKPATAAMQFGTIFHAVALEPQTVAVIPEINLFRKDGRHDRIGEQRELDAFMAKNQGKVFAKSNEFAQASAMVEVIKAHRIAGPLLAAPGEVELSGFFEEPVHNIPGKIRCDKIMPDDRIIMDLKSTTDASEEEFAKTIYNYGYDISGAWYNLGAHCIDKVSYDFLLVASEKDPPHACNVFRLTEKHFEIAYAKIDAILDHLKKCIDTNVWPAYPQRLISPEIPGWERTKYSKVVGY